MLKVIEIDRGDYSVVPCPFCGCVEFLRVTPRRNYEDLYDKYGYACISIECKNCNIEMYEHSVKEKNYHMKVNALINKWNHREV